jgi:hypothetical protein
MTCAGAPRWPGTGQVASAWPPWGTDQPPTNCSRRDRLVAEIRPTLLALFGAVGFLLLMACVNVANPLENTSREPKSVQAFTPAVEAVFDLSPECGE